MKPQQINYGPLNEKYFYMKHPSGLNIYLYPKKGYRSCYAVIGTNYGSVDSVFGLKDGKKVRVPAGIAHYLEHKLFAGKEADAFELYAKTGASANAYTSFDRTAYLFSCSENFQESLKILLNFVQNPYFTEENVEKERGIIAQEIKMYQDNPGWVVFFNLLAALYRENFVKLDIAGTVDSIAQITPENLYECYNAFYNLNNMCLSVAGNIDVESTLEVIDKNLGYSTPFETQRVVITESAQVAKPFVSQNFEITMPEFQLGFKEAVGADKVSSADLAYTDIISKALASKSTNMYNRLLDLNLINTASFGVEYFEAVGAASLIFSGESRDPQETSKIIKEEIAKFKKSKIDSDTLQWAKRSVYGEAVASFNSTESIADTFMEFAFAKRQLFDYIDAISKATTEDVNNRLDHILNEEFSALSVVKPNGQ